MKKGWFKIYILQHVYLSVSFILCLEVEGGSNPRSPEFYHPFVITDERMGGYDRLNEKQKDEVRVLAGVEFTRSVSCPLT